MPSSGPATPTAPLRRARVAAAAAFFANGAVLGSWVTRIPDVQSRLELTEGQLGVALLAIAAGALAGFPSASWLAERAGSRVVTVAAGVLYCLALPVLAVAGNLALLMVVLALFGFGTGAMDVSMNDQGVEVEQRYGRPVLSSMHAAFSAGGIVGAAAGGAALSAGMPAHRHLLLAALLLGAIIVASGRWLLPDVGTGHDTPVFARPSRDLVALGVVAFCSAVGEGAVADWSAVYLTFDVGVPALAAAGFAGFSVAMTVGRLTGDRLRQRFAAVTLLRTGGALSALGMALALLVPTGVNVVAGLVCVGAGLSLAFPLAFSLAGDVPAVARGPALAAVATVGYTGFLAGPPVIGFVAEATSLRVGLGLVVLASVAVMAVARRAAAAAQPAGSTTADV